MHRQRCDVLEPEDERLQIGQAKTRSRAPSAPCPLFCACEERAVVVPADTTVPPSEDPLSAGTESWNSLDQMMATGHMPALMAIQRDKAAGGFYNRLVKRGKPKMKDNVAVMRKLLHASYGAFKRRNTTPGKQVPSRSNKHDKHLAAKRGCCQQMLRLSWRRASVLMDSTSCLACLLACRLFSRPPRHVEVSCAPHNTW